MNPLLLEWLSHTRHLGASDLHLSAGLPPMVRRLGQLQALDAAPVSSDSMHTLLAEALPDWPHSSSALTERDNINPHNQDHDTALSLPDLGRFRVNVFAQQRGWSSVWRAIPSRIPALQDTGAPAVLRDWVQQPHGLLLVTGATGSGKSTTLAALVHHLNTTQALHILTLEDPIEFEHVSAKSLVQQRAVPGHSQSFDTALRAALRQDPDVIMVGELRDLTTIRLALSAAETGHLVLATLHTNDAVSAVTRLTDMGIEPFLLSSSLLGVLAQRLVRKVCTACQGSGCSLCGKTGYAGRTGIFELMTTDDALRAQIHAKQSEATLRDGALAGGMVLMREDGERLVQLGITRPEELLRVTRD